MDAGDARVNCGDAPRECAFAGLRTDDDLRDARHHRDQAGGDPRSRTDDEHGVHVAARQTRLGGPVMGTVSRISTREVDGRRVACLPRHHRIRTRAVAPGTKQRERYPRPT